ncbi:DUF2497 domain-containing protein [Qipengyuania sp. DGS5-3]|uniref:DUF2497 domain-containing protein n=1 Tax=Qipengyuania sp. DGS5-3 TaxID=3349632 RepID=UPI0036D390AC
MQQTGEPSVEEILDSIKKVIARDNRDGIIAERRERTGLVANSDQTASGSDDLIESASEDKAEEVLELSAEVELEAEAEAEDTDAKSADALITEATRSAMQENFAALAMISKPSKQPQIVRSGETSLEGLVSDMLRPMLAEWLDANLPDMVEELVKAEIARIAGKRGE